MHLSPFCLTILSKTILLRSLVVLVASKMATFPPSRWIQPRASSNAAFNRKNYYLQLFLRVDKMQIKQGTFLITLSVPFMVQGIKSFSVNYDISQKKAKFSKSAKINILFVCPSTVASFLEIFISQYSHDNKWPSNAHCPYLHAGLPEGLGFPVVGVEEGVLQLLGHLHVHLPSTHHNLNQCASQRQIVKSCPKKGMKIKIMSRGLNKFFLQS